MGLKDHIEGAIHGEKGEQTQAQQPAQQPQQPAPAAEPAKPETHHGRDFASKLGNAATFGAGATAGSDAVNGLIGAFK